jgi:hypothetical protein
LRTAERGLQRDRARQTVNAPTGCGTLRRSRSSIRPIQASIPVPVCADSSTISIRGLTCAVLNASGYLPHRRAAVGEPARVVVGRLVADERADPQAWRQPSECLFDQRRLARAPGSTGRSRLAYRRLRNAGAAGHAATETLP